VVATAHQVRERRKACQLGRVIIQGTAEVTQKLPNARIIAR